MLIQRGNGIVVATVHTIGHRRHAGRNDGHCRRRNRHRRRAIHAHCGRRHWLRLLLLTKVPVEEGGAVGAVAHEGHCRVGVHHLLLLICLLLLLLLLLLSVERRGEVLADGVVLVADAECIAHQIGHNAAAAVDVDAVGGGDGGAGVVALAICNVVSVRGQVEGAAAAVGAPRCCGCRRRDSGVLRRDGRRVYLCVDER